MKMKRTFLHFMSWTTQVVLFCFFMHNANALEISTGEIELGKWNSNFNAGTKYAERNGIPLVLVYTSPSCANCIALKSALESNAATAWAEERQMVMIMASGDDNAREFAKNDSLELPYVCVYWPKKGADSVTGRFSGLLGKMPVSGVTLDDEFIASCDFYTDGWEGIYKSAEFKVGVSEANRLEAIAGKTTYVDIPLVRSEIYAGNAETNYLLSLFPTFRFPVTNRLEWAAGEWEKTVRLDFPDDYEPYVGDMINLSLSDGSGAAGRTSSVTVVEEPPNSSVNPLWLTDEFRFGAWTMDYDAATNAVARKIAEGESAYTLVMFTGSLWCPYCKGLEASLLSDKRFYDWAESNNVALVEFDQGRASSPSTPAGTRAPRLLTYEPDPRSDPANTISGAGYLSRKMISPEDAERVISQTTKYTSKWIAPGTSAARLGNPTILLVKDDEVVARFTSHRDDEKVYDQLENIGRLNDFLKLANRDGEDDDYPITKRSLIAGEAAEATFQISDRNEWFSLSRVFAGRFSAEVTNETPVDVVFTLVQGGVDIACATNSLVVTIGSAEAEKGNFHLRVSSYGDTGIKYFNAENPVDTTVFTAAFATRMVMVPEERRSSCSAVGTFDMEVFEDTVYRFSGFDLTSESADFVLIDSEKGLYRAVKSGVVAMEAVLDSALYQIWRPGDVSFDDAVINCSETDGFVTIAVSRKGGSSDVARVRVGLEPLENALVPVETYVWEDVVLEWGDGESGTTNLVLVLRDDVVADGDRKMKFDLKMIEGDAVTSKVPQCEVNVADDDEPNPGTLAIAAVVPSVAAKDTVVMKTSGTLELHVARLEGAAGAAVVRAVLSDGSLPPVELVWRDNDRVAVKIASFDLAARPVGASGVFSVSLEDSTIPVKNAKKTIYVKVVDDGAPGFSVSDTKFPFVRYVNGRHEIDLTGIPESAITGVEKVSGTLPSGLTAEVNVKQKTFALTGAPKASGEWDCVYQVWTVRDGVKVVGGTVKIVVAVTDPVREDEDFNQAVESSFTVFDVPVFDTSLERLVGLMTVSVRSTGRNSAKYICAAGTKSLVSSEWSSCGNDGSHTAELATRDGEYRLTLTVRPDGAVVGEVVDPAFVYDDLRMSGSRYGWSRADSAEDWEGRYTIAFVPKKRVSGVESAAVTGCAGFAAKLSGATARSYGRMTVAGRLPNGRSVSGSFTLQRREDAVAMLPIYARSSADVFAGVADIAAGAADAMAHDRHRAISNSVEAVSSWTHTERKTDTGSFVMNYDVYGSYYDPDEDLAECLAQTGVSPSVDFTAWTEELVESRNYGMPPSVFSGNLPDVSGDWAGLSGDIRLRLNRSTGIVTGRVLIPFENRTVTASAFGVILPGWTGCGCVDGDVSLPFMLGACWFSDSLYYSVDYKSCTEKGDPDRSVTVKKGCKLTGETR